MDLVALLPAIAAEVRPLVGTGAVASYIPPLAAVDPARFGLAVRTVDGAEHGVGDSDDRFSIQSIAKVLALAVAMDAEGNALWARVGREPSGTAFNSLVQLEADGGVPRNPMINAGALVVMDAVLAHSAPGATPILDLVRSAADDATLAVDHAVAEAEIATAHRTRALAHFLKAFGTLRGDPDTVVEAYCRLCAVSMSCVELCRAFTFLATGGRSPSGEAVVSPRQAKRLNAVMLTCGVYDEAGDFAYRVGLPAKSGVGGGIVAVMPGEFVAAAWSPGLGPRGNSVAGTAALEALTTRTGRSIF
ncbi:glutaminase [Rubrivirga sp. IMCC45206]|uniref:glutaminase n=1 Tax=Rubrivirga sp. IMCC45206 TaxID=3391614 RepID=UPI003990390F